MYHDVVDGIWYSYLFLPLKLFKLNYSDEWNVYAMFGQWCTLCHRLKISVCISYTFTWLKLKSKQLQHFSDAKAYIKQPVICLYDSVCRINNISKFLTNKQNNFHHRRNTWFSLLHWLTVLWWKRNFARNSFLRRIS